MLLLWDEFPVIGENLGNFMNRLLKQKYFKFTYYFLDMLMQARYTVIFEFLNFISSKTRRGNVHVIELNCQKSVLPICEIS